MKICIFSGAANPHSPAVEQDAITFATWCAENKHVVINGGTGMGLMQIVASTTLEAGGKLLSINLGKLHPESHGQTDHQLLENMLVKNLHERLELMTHHADCFVALAGGVGTLHEILQVWADLKLSLHRKPLHILNTDGFYDPLKTLVEHTVKSGYTSQKVATIATFHSNVKTLINALLTST